MTLLKSAQLDNAGWSFVPGFLYQPSLQIHLNVRWGGEMQGVCVSQSLLRSVKVVALKYGSAFLNLTLRHQAWGKKSPIFGMFFMQNYIFNIKAEGD